MHVTALFWTVLPLITFFSPLQRKTGEHIHMKLMSAPLNSPVLSDGVYKGDVITLTHGYLVRVWGEGQSRHLVAFLT